MKHLNIFALVLGISAVSSYVENNKIIDVSANQICSQVEKLLNESECEIKIEMNVNVMFKINSEGEIIVLHITSKDKEIINHVRKTLKNKTIQLSGEFDQVFKIPVSIKRG